MERYIALKDFEISTYRPAGSNVPQYVVSFKKGEEIKGDIIDGGNIGIGIFVNTSNGTVRFPLNNDKITVDMRGRGFADGRPPQKTVVTPPVKKTISTGAIIGISVGAVIVIGTIIFIVRKFV